MKGQQLCNSDHNLPLKFRVVNRTDMVNTEVGSCITSLNEMTDKKFIELLHSRDGHSAGELIINRVNIVEIPTFVDYLRSGWGISLSVAIDFTGSNGDYTSPSSLHYLGGNSQY